MIRHLGFYAILLPSTACHSVGTLPLVQNLEPSKPEGCNLDHFFKHQDIGVPTKDICHIKVMEWLLPFVDPDPQESLRLGRQQLCRCGAEGFYFKKTRPSLQQFVLVGYVYTQDAKPQNVISQEQHLAMFSCLARSNSQWTPNGCISQGDFINNSGGRFVDPKSR